MKAEGKRGGRGGRKEGQGREEGEGRRRKKGRRERGRQGGREGREEGEGREKGEGREEKREERAIFYYSHLSTAPTHLSKSFHQGKSSAPWCVCQMDAIRFLLMSIPHVSGVLLGLISLCVPSYTLTFFFYRNNSQRWVECGI